MLVNDDVDRSLEIVRAIVLAERARPHLQKGLIEPIVESFQT